MRLFVVPILDYPCYAQQPVHNKFLWWSWDSQPHHDLKIEWVHYSLMWWEIKLVCKYCGANHKGFGIDDATLIKILKLKKLPSKDNFEYFDEEDLEKYQ
jgi:hypothetical protein